MTDLRRFAEPGRMIDVRIMPNALRAQVTLDGERFLIRVTCATEDGRVNMAVTRLLAKALGLPVARLTLVRGQTDRDKLFQVV